MRVLILLTIAIYLTGCYSKTPEKTGFEGKPVPSFKLRLIDSVTVFDTRSIPEGKPFALFSFGPHCPYSKAQMEDILDKMDILKNINFYVFTQSSFNEMKLFYNHYSLSKYPNVVMGRDYDYFFSQYFKTPGVPYIALYNKDKKLKRVFIGKTPIELIKEESEK